MDESAHPPVRLLALSSGNLSTKNAKTRVDAFIADFQNRSTKSGDATVTVQLQKLSGALQQKLDRRKHVQA